MPPFQNPLASSQIAEEKVQQDQSILTKLLAQNNNSLFCFWVGLEQNSPPHRVNKSSHSRSYYMTTG